MKGKLRILGLGVQFCRNRGLMGLKDFADFVCKNLALNITDKMSEP